MTFADTRKLVYVRQPVGVLDAHHLVRSRARRRPSAGIAASRASSSTAPTCSPSAARRNGPSRRRARQRPTLLECLTLRRSCEVHDDAFYVPKVMFERWAERDPLGLSQLAAREREHDRRRGIDALEEGLERRSSAQTTRRCRIRPRFCDGAPRRRKTSHSASQVVADSRTSGDRRRARTGCAATSVFVIGEDVGVYGRLQGDPASRRSSARGRSSTNRSPGRRSSAAPVQR